jgi:hypothetical protein
MFSCLCDCFFTKKKKKKIEELKGITIVKNDNSIDEIVFNKGFNSFTNNNFDNSYYSINDNINVNINDNNNNNNNNNNTKKFYLNKRALNNLDKYRSKSLDLDYQFNNISNEKNHIGKKNEEDKKSINENEIDNLRIEVIDKKEFKQSKSDSIIQNKKSKSSSIGSEKSKSLSDYGFENIDIDIDINNELRRRKIKMTNSDDEWDDVFE